VQATRRVNNEGRLDTTIRKILRNPAHKGEPEVTDKDPDDIRAAKKITVPVFEADGKTVGRGIVDAATWDRAQAQRAARTTNGRRRDTMMMLQGRVWCSCGRRLSPHRDGRTYRCATRKNIDKRHGGQGYQCKAARLEEVVKTFIRAFLAEPAI